MFENNNSLNQIIENNDIKKKFRFDINEAERNPILMKYDFNEDKYIEEELDFNEYIEEELNFDENMK